MVCIKDEKCPLEKKDRNQIALLRLGKEKMSSLIQRQYLKNKPQQRIPF